LKLLVSAGGTGGHLYPALSVLAELGRIDPAVEVLFVGRRGGIEREAAERTSTDYRAVTTAPWPTRLSFNFAVSAFRNAAGIAQSAGILLRFRPDVVFTTGGYVSLPVALAAGLMRRKLVIHEQNRMPGRATRLAARFATRIALGTEELPPGFPETRTVYVGTPVRADLLERRPSTESARTKFGLDPVKFTVLVLGGSQGASSINRATSDTFNRLDPITFQILISTGTSDFDEVARLCRGSEVQAEVRPFIDDMNSAYAAADLVVCRSGASTLAEIAAVGLPSVLVPYPYAAGGHQQENAERFVQAGASRMILDRDLTGDTLATAISEIERDTDGRTAMANAARKLARPDAARTIARLLIDVVGPTNLP